MSSSSQAPARKYKGRGKVKLQKIENEKNSQVTFCKRRAGLFKKASELCIRCAAEMLLVVFSPSGKAFSYGHPDVEHVADRFMNGDTPDQTTANASIEEIIMEVSRNSNIRARNLELTQLESSLATERKRAKELGVNKKNGRKEGWIPPPFDQFSSEHLKFFGKTVSNYENHFDEVVGKFPSMNLNPTSVFNANNNQGNSVGFNDVAAGFNDYAIASNTGEVTVPFPPEFNNCAAGFIDPGVYPNIGETSIANNTGAIPNQYEFNNCAPGFGDTGVYATGVTNVANNISAPVSVPTEFTDWIPSFDNTGVYTGVANNNGANSVQAEFDNWASGFYNTGETTNDGVQDPMDLIPDDLFAAPCIPNALVPGGVSNPFNLTTDDPRNDIFHGGSGPGVAPGFNDGCNPN